MEEIARVSDNKKSLGAIATDVELAPESVFNQQLRDNTTLVLRELERINFIPEGVYFCNEDLEGNAWIPKPGDTVCGDKVSIVFIRWYSEKVHIEIEIHSYKVSTYMSNVGRPEFDGNRINQVDIYKLTWLAPVKKWWETYNE